MQLSLVLLTVLSRACAKLSTGLEKLAPTGWHILQLCDSGYFYLSRTKINPRHMWPLRHLITWVNMTWPTFWNVLIFLKFCFHENFPFIEPCRDFGTKTKSVANKDISCSQFNHFFSVININLLWQKVTLLIHTSSHAKCWQIKRCEAPKASKNIQYHLISCLECISSTIASDNNATEARSS